MAGYKVMLLGVLLAVAALLATAAAVDDEHMYHWKCFKSCTGSCREEGAPVDVGDAMDGSNSNVSSVVSGGGKCKNRCLNECFEDLPVICYHQCVVTNCLHLPPFSKDKVTCLKSCCAKCFHHGPPAPGPGPKPPKPPAPGPPPKPKPKPPTPGPPKPKPKPPTPGPPKPKPPTPCPPTPKPKPKPKPPAPKPPTPKAPPPPRKPCPPASDKLKAASNDN